MFLLLSLTLLLLNGTSPPVSPQQPPVPDAAFYRSPYRGRLITHPEAISGVWEASDGHGGVIGIDLQLATNLIGKTRAPLHGETWDALTVGIYDTSSPSPLLGEEHFFTDSKQGGSVLYDHRHLVLHIDTTDLDLTLQPSGNWTGRFHSGSVDATVTFVEFGSRAREHPGLVGTWRQRAWADVYSCLHIAEPLPGSITAWIDQHQNVDLERFATQIPRPPTSLQIYGSRLSVRPLADHQLILQTLPSLAACCAQVSRASVEHGILHLSPGPDPMPAWSLNSTRWDRMPGNTCAPPPPPPGRSVFPARLHHRPSAPHPSRVPPTASLSRLLLTRMPPHGPAPVQ